MSNLTTKHNIKLILQQAKHAFIVFLQYLTQGLSLTTFMLALLFYAISGIFVIGILYLGTFFNKIAEECNDIQ
tara:strand:+ start:353 stop:571 length:219 start_codon:yes stop_codon:yes gene_type:complete